MVTSSKSVRELVTIAVARCGAKRVASTLGLSIQGTLNLAVPGARTHAGTEAQATVRRRELEALLAATDSEPPPSMREAS